MNPRAHSRLQNALERKKVATNTEIVQSPVTAEKAADNRMSLAKAIYGRMFDWLVQRVNRAMEGDFRSSSNIIGAARGGGDTVLRRPLIILPSHTQAQASSTSSALRSSS